MEFPDYIKARKRTKDLTLTRIFDIDDSLKDIALDKTYFIRTYGCQMNEHDTERIKALLEAMGFREEEDYRLADLAILNTCSIRENAHNKAFGMLGRFKHVKETTNPNLIVGLGGCMSQEEGVAKTVFEKYKWLNFVFGTHNIDVLPRLVKRSMEDDKLQIEVLSGEGDIIEGMPLKRAHDLKAFVDIIYGCDKFCTYCIVPFTRGAQRSRSKEDILKEINDLIKEGYKEVTLLGQNVNAYGKDLADDYTMANLLEDVAKTGIGRVRFMTSHPWDFSDEMIDIIAKYPNISKAVHLPVQSGSSRILKLMGRRYTKESYLELYEKIRERVPGASISTDIIVGFPGETEEDFQETLDLCNACHFDAAFTYIYSPRENTPAAKLKGQVSKDETSERLARLNKIVNEHSLESNEKRLGQKQRVLIEGLSERGTYFGYNDGNRLINVSSDEDIVGRIVEAVVDNAKTWSLDGKRK